MKCDCIVSAYDKRAYCKYESDFVKRKILVNVEENVNSSAEMDVHNGHKKKEEKKMAFVNGFCGWVISNRKLNQYDE